MTAFFKSLGFSKRTRASWGVQRKDLILLCAWEDELSGPPFAVRVRRDHGYKASQTFALRERTAQLAQLWAGAAAGYVVMATAKRPQGESRSIQSFRSDIIFPITQLVAGRDDIWARLGEAVATSDFKSHIRRFKTRNAVGIFPPLGEGGTGEESFARRLQRFARVEVRPEQKSFRNAVFRACNGRCVVTGCALSEAVEAAHLRGKSWRAGYNSVTDGVLLRRDLHALYDRGLLSFTVAGRVVIKPRARAYYGELHGSELLFAPTSLKAREG